MFGALDPEKLLVVLALALIVIGPDRLPKLARQLGSYWRTLGELRGRLEGEMRSALPDLREVLPDRGDLPRIPRNPRAAMTAFVTDLVREEPHQTAAGPHQTAAGEELAAVSAAWHAASGEVTPAAAVHDPTMN
jgi:Sec-independent protein translocase protein TatA